MKHFNFLLIITTFFMNIGFAGDAVIERELTPDQQVTFVGAIRDCMVVLNTTCRYPTAAENSFSLPETFFELADFPGMPGYKMVVHLNRDASISQALDSLRGDANRHIIDCELATTFCYLQGVRAVIENDKIFDRVYNMFGVPNQKRELTRSESYKRIPFMDALLREQETCMPGALCGIGQLNDSNSFNLPHNFSSLRYQYGGGDVYSIKHLEGSMLGLNVIMLDETSCVFFEPGTGVTPLTGAVNLLIDGLDADLTADEIASVRIPLQHVGPLNSIKYKNRETAMTQILSQVMYSAPNFTKVFEYVNDIHVAEVRASEKLFVNKFLRERKETGGKAILRALLGVALEKQYSTLQAAITSVGEAESSAQILDAINALKIADATT